MKRLLIFTLIAAALLSACGSNELEVHEPWARSASQGENGVVYLILHNHSDVDDELTGASSDVAEAVEIHESVLSADGVMQMVSQAIVPLGTGEEVEFHPGGLHIMLVNLKSDLKVGETLTLTLHFKNHADIVLSVPVQDTPGMDDS